MIRTFTKNKDGKIEFTERELKKLLDEVYENGYQEGKNKSTFVYTTPNWWTWNNPNYYTYCSSTNNSIDTTTKTTLGDITTTADATIGFTKTSNIKGEK